MNLVNIFLFYDRLCSWEQGSKTSVIHSECAKNFVKIISGFTEPVRRAALQTLTKSNLESNDLVVKSEKLKSVVNLSDVSNKINSQSVQLYLTSQVGLLTQNTSNAGKRSAGFEYMAILEANVENNGYISL